MPLVSQGDKLHNIHTHEPRPKFLYLFFFIKITLQRRSRNVTCSNKSCSSLADSFHPVSTFSVASQDTQTLLICINTSNMTPFLSFAATSFVLLALNFTCHSYLDLILQPQLPEPESLFPHPAGQLI